MLDGLFDSFFLNVSFFFKKKTFLNKFLISVVRVFFFLNGNQKSLNRNSYVFS